MVITLSIFDMKVLVACEESQTICKAFRALGHEAYSCDLLPCSGGHPEWHIQGDVTKFLSNNWDLMIAHPPCTYLSVSGLHWNNRVPGRAQKTEEALEFVQTLMDAPIEMIAIENPVSCISSRISKPDQILQPYMFGHPESKATCLWLKNLPLIHWVEIAQFKEYRCICGELVPEDHGKYGCCGEIRPMIPLWKNQTASGQNKLGPSKDRALLRSKTYSGIAEAMADQWSLHFYNRIGAILDLVK